MGGNQLFSYGWLVVMNGRGTLGQEMLGPGGPDSPFGTLRRWFLRGAGGGQGLPLPIAETELGDWFPACPARCFRRVPPEPPGPNKVCSRPPV